MFARLIRECRDHKPIPSLSAGHAAPFSLKGALEAAEAGIIEPLLVGSEKEIRTIADSLGLDLGTHAIVSVKSEEEAAQCSTALCRSGDARGPDERQPAYRLFVRFVLQKEGGLRTTRRISHVFIMEAPLYDRVLLITDAAINIYPTLEDKVDIVKNVIDLAHGLGIPEPKVAILSAIETVNPKITSTLDAAALCKMADRGQITGAVLDGPLAFDTAVSEGAAKVKNLQSPVAGRADILVVPDLESGNMLAKQLEYLGGASLAGVVMGATVPIILTSRADAAESRVASCAVASMLSFAEKEQNKTV